MIRVSGKSKSRLVKAAGAESCGQRRNRKLHAAVATSIFWSQNEKKTEGFGALFEVGMWKNCTPLWRQVYFEVKMLKNCGVRSTFWSGDVEKLHAAAVRSTFSSENAQNTSASDHFLKFRCRKIARRCGEKHIFKWKCTKHVSFAVARSTFPSQNAIKNLRSRSIFWSSDVEKLQAAVARSTFVSQNVQNTCVLAHFLKFRCRKISQVVS